MGNSRNTGYLQNIVQYDASNNVILPSLTGTGSRMVISSSTGVLSAQDIPTLSALGGVPTSRTLTINGVSYDLSANRSWSALPIGGTTGQILTKNSGTDYDAAWMENYADWTAVLKHRVKASEAITKGQAVYVSSADGTNMIVSKASNATEGTSSKTMGLLESTVSTNGIANVITEGLLAGLNTASANAGDPVWLGIGGNLIYGLLNKPIAPAHLVFIGVVTRSNANNGEIFVKVQNGFEFGELHDYVQTGVLDNYVISYESSTSLYKPKSIATLLGYTPANAARTITINGTSYDLSANRSWTINSMIYPGAGIAVSTGTAWGTSLTDNSSNWNTAYGWGNHASAGYATTTYVGTQIANLVASSPATLDTLNELAAALGNDAAFSTTVSTALGNRLRVDINTQGLSATLQGYGRTNLGLGTAATSNTGDFAAASHTHSIANVTGLQTALDGKQASGSYAAATHSHIISDVTGLQTALDGKQASLGFTPYNSTNPSGYITSSALSSYLPLAGGTLTGQLIVAYNSGTEPYVNAVFRAVGGANIGGVLVNGTTQSHIRFLVGSDTWNGAGAKQWQIRVGNGGGEDNLKIYSWTKGNDTMTILNNGNTTIHGTITASNFSGSSSGTNTGDQTIPTNNNQLTNGAGYITSYTETSTLANVTARGASTSIGITINPNGTSITMGGDSSAEGIRMQASTSTTYPVFLRAVNPTGGNETSAWIFKEADTAWGIWHNNPINALDFTRASTSGIEQNVGGGTNTVMIRLNMTNGSGQFYGNVTGANLSGTNTGDQTNISGNAATASSVAWSGISTAYRENYDLGFRPADNSSSYAGFRFASPGNDANAGYLLVRGGADNDVYTQNGITIVADLGWLTLAQRSTASKGVRIMTGTSSTTRMEISTAGLLSVYGTSHAATQTSFSPSLHIRGSYYGGPRLQVYGLDADPNGWMGLGTDMAAGAYQFSLYYSDVSGSSISFGRFNGGNGTRYSGYTTTALLSYAGTFTAAGDIVAYGSPSDISLKTNIKPLESSLDKIIKLQGVSFTWKEDTDASKLTEIKDDLGFIAQEVQKVLPELVRKNKDNGLLSLRDKGIMPLLVEAVKELKAENDTQKSEIDELKDLVKQLINR